MDKVILKYTTINDTNKPPVDKLKQINKIRPVTLAGESEIKPLMSFHENEVTQKIQRMI